MKNIACLIVLIFLYINSSLAQDYELDLDYLDNLTLFTLNQGQFKKERVTSDEKTIYGLISPNKKYVAYVKKTEGKTFETTSFQEYEANELWLYNISTKKHKLLKVGSEEVYDLWFNHNIQFSADSKYIICSSFGGSMGVQLYKIDIETKQLSKIPIDLMYGGYKITSNGLIFGKARIYNEKLEGLEEVYHLFNINGKLINVFDDNITPVKKSNYYNGNSGSFIDKRDGHEYKWVEIGEQTWMAENLAYLPRNNKESWKNYKVYGSNEVDYHKLINNIYLEVYGVLYDKDAAESACPEGWHLPSIDEWRTLKSFVKNEKNDVGKYLIDNNEWECDGVNTYGFSALPGGEYQRSFNKGFQFIGIQGTWWSATHIYDTQSSYHYSISDCSFYEGDIEGDEENCYSVRCIKD